MDYKEKSNDHKHVHPSNVEGVDVSKISPKSPALSPGSPRSPKRVQGTHNADALSVSPLKASMSPKSPRSPGSPRSPKRIQGMQSVDSLSVSPLKLSTSPKSPQSLRSPRSPKSPQGSPSLGSFLKNRRNSFSGRDGRPKKGGSGGKGTWGGLLDVEGGRVLDQNDPNYTTEEEDGKLIVKINAKFEEFKKKATTIVEEYFNNDDIISTTNELRELDMPNYNYYFVKKLISMAMDRRDNEKEMASILLSSLYGDVIDSQQLYKGFQKLVEVADDLIVDIPDTVDVLALFIARAVFDDVLPPSFLTKVMSTLRKDSKGIDVINRAEKGYLSTPLHSEAIERRWGGSKNKTVTDLKAKIDDLLTEYVASGDIKEALWCIKDLHVPHFNHEVVKRAVTMVMEKRQAERCLLELLKAASEEGLINSSQVSKGFSRIIELVDDLSLDIPNARALLQSLISKASSEGWLCASSLKSLSSNSGNRLVQDNRVEAFKKKSQSIIQEYFLSGDVSEVIRCLESENSSSLPELNAIFIKKLITLSMDKKNREKEMASVLLSSLCFPSDDVVAGFTMLLESAGDTALDIPVIVEDLAMFLARAEVDEVLTPKHLEEIGNQFSELSEPNMVANKAVSMAFSLLKVRLSGERILRCWGGGGSCSNGWSIEDVKDKIGKLLEEFESGGDMREACRCIKELGMPFFHHEVVKKCLVMLVENKKKRMWRLLHDCYGIGLLTTHQMTNGFRRVAEGLDDLALDVPDAKKQFKILVDRADREGWLDPWFDKNGLEVGSENGHC